MKKILSLIFCLCVFLLTPTMARADPIYPLKVSSNQRYLVDQNNVPFFWVGDSSWSIIAQGTNADIDTYLANRAVKGFNVVLASLIEHKFADHAPKNIDNVAPFTGTAFTTPNDSYFTRADYLVTQAALKGMTILMDPLYVGYACNSDGWCAEMKAASNADMASWGTYVGNRYKNFANIVWLVGGDTDPVANGVDGKLAAFAAALHIADPVHLITEHNARGQMAISPWDSNIPTWLNLNNIYTTNISYPLAETAYNTSPIRPFFEVESYYENEHSMTNQGLRAEAYWTILAGGMGFNFGNCPLWGLGSATMFSYCNTQGRTWQQSLDLPGSVNMNYFKQLFTSFAWQNLVPDFNHTVVTSGYGTNGNTDYVTTARASDGSIIVAYLPTIRTITVDMTKLAGPTTAMWFDPTNNTYATIVGSPFANTGTHQFTPTGNNSGGDGDWVLVLEVSSPPPTPSPNPDFDGDGVVDMDDYNSLLSSFGTYNCSYNLTGDCMINIFDFSLLVEQFGS